ncbi:hypothetical protein JCM11251_003077 [Rhodosporidiobolus azoricus]
MRPTSIASSPSANVDSARPVVNPQRAQNVKRTYGRKVVLDVPSTADVPQGENRALDRQSTEIVPETEFDAPHSGSTSEAEAVERRRTAVTSSSPSRRNVHSTDPTSEDSGSDGENETDGKLAAFIGAKSIAEQLADLDKQFDEMPDDLLPMPPTQFRHLNEAGPSSSSLPHLTTSEDASSRHNASSSQNTPVAMPSFHPSSTSILEDIAAALPPRLPSSSQAEEETEQPIHRSKKVVARIADSDDDDEEAEPAAKPPRKGKQRIVESDSESAAHDSHASARSSSPVKATATVKERIQALAAKRTKAAPSVEEKQKPVYEDMDDNISGDDGSDGSRTKKRGGKKAASKKSKGLSKKELDEMNRQTAAFARTNDVRLHATRKTVFSVADLAKQVTKESYLPTPPITNPKPSKLAAVALETSSDAIADSSPADAGPSRPRLSFNALGKHRESSPVFDINATPVPHRDQSTPRALDWSAMKKKTVAPPEPLAKEGEEKEDSDDEGELISLDAMLDKQKRAKEEQAKKEEGARLKEEKRQKLLAKKQAAIAAAAAAAAAAADSDSDIEIEGLPGAPSQKRSSANRGKKADVFDVVKSETPQRGASVRKLFQRFAGVDVSHPPDEDDEPTESQFEAAGKEFGRNLDPKQHHIPTPARTGKTAKSKLKASSRRAANTPITHETLGQALLHKTHEQFQKIRVKKQDKYYRDQRRTADNGDEVQAVNVKELMEKKKKQADEDEAMEEDEDGDYRDDDEEEEDEAASGGSGSEADFGLASGSDVPSGQDGRKKGGEEEEEEEVDSDGGLRMPASSQNSDRMGKAPADEDDDEAESMPPPATKRSKPVKRLIFDDDEEEESQRRSPATTARRSVSTTPAPTEVVPTAPATVVEAVPLKLDGLFAGADAGGDGGFSQFFDSQFSQDAAGDDAQADGFFRPANDDFAAPAPTMFLGQPLISTAERDADAARLEKRGGFNDAEPATPREAPAVRQYINQQGFLTQTRPANLFADSPSDSPGLSFRQTLSTRNSESQLGGDTQLQTPTQHSKDPTRLRRLDAMVTYGSLPATEVQPAATEVVQSAASKGDEIAETQDAEEETQEESFPTAAQPPTIAVPSQPKNAFHALRAGAAQEGVPPPLVSKESKHRRKSAFVDDQANLSDEEDLGLGGVSGDEDENGMDAELESLVDNEEVDKDLRDEQDAMVDELHAAEMEKKHEEDLKRAQRIADGKERNKRKGIDLSDDEFDDDYVRRRADRAKKQRMDSMTTEQLKANEETQAFAGVLTDACIATSKTNEYSFLAPAEHSDIDEDDDGYDSPQEPAADVFGGIPELPAIKTTFKEAQALALRRQQERRAREEDEDEDDARMAELDREIDGYGGDLDLLPIHLGGGSSSPVAPFKLNNRIVEAKTTTVVQVDEFAEIDSQYSLFRQDSLQATVQYKAGDGREESQSAAIAGGRSAVTSFKRSAPGKSASSSSFGSGAGSSKGKSGGAALGPKASKFGALRKSGFA